MNHNSEISPARRKRALQSTQVSSDQFVPPNMIIPTEPTILHNATTMENPLLENGKLAWYPSPEGKNHRSSNLSDRTAGTYVDESSCFGFGEEEPTHDVSSDDNDEQPQGPLVAPSHRSILKKSKSDDSLFIQAKSKAWNCLPPPDLSESSVSSISQSTSTNSLACSDKTSCSDKSKRVSFDAVLIRSYEQTMGDNPAVSYGPPIQLDWDYEQHEGVDIDCYESERCFSRRPYRRLVLSYYQRKAVLSRKGFSDKQLTKAKKDANKLKLQRVVTNTFLPIMKVEDALESASRKAKRLIRKGKE